MVTARVNHKLLGLVWAMLSRGVGIVVIGYEVDGAGRAIGCEVEIAGRAFLLEGGATSSCSRRHSVLTGSGWDEKRGDERRGVGGGVTLW